MVDDGYETKNEVVPPGRGGGVLATTLSVLAMAGLGALLWLIFHMVF